MARRAAESSVRAATLSAVNRTLLAACAAVTIAGGLVAVAGCSDDDSGNAERFCGQIAARKAELTTPDLQHSEDIEPLLDLYRSIGDLAPLAIEEEWGDLVSAYETASTMVIGDAESEQSAVAAIYSAEASAAAVDSWLKANCAVDIGPIVTLVPHQP